MTIPSPDGRAFPGDDLMALAPTALQRLYGPSSTTGQDRPAFERKGAVAVVSIQGPLQRSVDRYGYYDSYDAIGDRLTQALSDRSTGAVLLRINSPGGVAAGCFEAVKAMRAQADASGKPVFAFADEMACSAAYALACVADQIWLPPSGDVGSVGVIATYLDMTELAKAFGVRAIVTKTGERKADGHPLTPFTDEEIAALQARVDHLGALFFDLVASSRPMKASEVKALEAAILSGENAVEGGLADTVGSYADCLAAAEAAATQHLRGFHMKTIAQAHGLSEQATESDVVVAAVALRDKSKSLAEENTSLLSDKACLAARVAELEGKLAASVPKAEADKIASALQATIDTQASSLAALEKSKAEADKKLKALDDARLVAKVESFIGKKAGVTPASREEWISLARENEARFDSLIEKQPDAAILGGPVIEPSGNETRPTDGADARIARINQLTSERVKTTGEKRQKAMAAVMREHPELCES